MADSLIGSLRVALSLGTADFEAGANKAAAIAKSKAKDIETSFSSAKAAVTGFFAAFTVGLLAEQIKKSLDYAGSLAEVSRTLGVTTKDLQTLRFAATQTGVAQDQLEVGLRRLTVSIGKAELGSKAQIKAFQALGISVEDLKGKTTGDVFRMLADSLSKVTDRSQRAAIEMILMGRSGSTLDNLLAPGSKRLNELAEAAQTLGIVLSDQQIQNAEQTAHKLEAVKMVLSAQIAGVVADNAGAILSLSSALATLTGEIVRFLGSNPQLALGIVGALLGGRIGGIPGAVIGGAAGAILGGKVGQIGADSNPDLQFRIEALKKAQQAWIAAKNGTQMAGLAGAEAFFGGRGVATDEKSAYSEWLRQKNLLDQAVAQSRTPSQAAPGVDLPKFLGGGGKKKKAPTDQSDELLDKFAKEEVQADLAILQAKQQLAGNSEQRLQLAIQIIELEKTIKDAEIDEQVVKAKRDLAEHKITQTAYDEIVASAKRLKAAEDIATQIKLQALVEQQLAKAETANFQIAEQQLKFRTEALHTADQLATNQADHRRIQLAILDAEMEQQRLQLEKNKLDAQRNGATAEEIKVIQDQINNLGNQKAQSQSLIIHNTQDPLHAWAQEVPKTAQDIVEAFQKIEVNGLDQLTSAFAGVISGTESLKQAFSNMATSIVSEIATMIVKMMLFRALSSVLGLGGIPKPDLGLGSTSPSFGAGYGSVVPSSADFGFLPGFASGGSIVVGGMGGTDMNVLSLNNVPIARVSYGESVNIQPANDGPMGPSLPPLTMYNDFRGADPGAVASINQRLNQMQAEFPYRVVQAWYDAYGRNVIRP